jgi:hypothetical protein
MNHQQVYRVLAFDVRAQRCGYAVMEAPARLVDWGVLTVEMGHCEAISRLFDRYQPSVVVLRRRKAGEPRDTPGGRRNERVIRTEARRRSVSVAYLSQAALWRLFRQHCQPTKYGIAALLAARFPQLRWKLPPPRKAWKKEPRRMSVFDAVQLATAFLALHTGNDRIFQPPGPV